MRGNLFIDAKFWTSPGFSCYAGAPTTCSMSEVSGTLTVESRSSSGAEVADQCAELGVMGQETMAIGGKRGRRGKKKKEKGEEERKVANFTGERRNTNLLRGN